MSCTRSSPEWNKGELDSYLIEISSHIFAKKDEDGKPLVDKILDTAGQKGTGKWTVFSSLDLGQPVTLIGESVFARCLSALKEERVEASKILEGTGGQGSSVGDRAAFIEDVRRALYCSKIVSYAQGYMLLRAAAKENGWNLNMGGIALMWRGGCIIRSRFLGKIKEAFDKNPGIENLLLDSFFSAALNNYQASWRKARGSCGRDWACRRRHSPPRWRSSTAIAPRGCPPTCCKRNATTSARIPMSAPTSRAASSSTPTGPDTEGGFRPRLIPFSTATV